MTMPENIRRWCQESPNNPISTKLRRNAAPIIALFTMTILAFSFFSYISYVATQSNIQVIQQPDVPTQPKPNTSPSAGSNTSQKQPVTPASQQQLPPDYPSTTPSEMERIAMLDSRVVMNEQGERVLQIVQDGRVIAEFSNATGFVGGWSSLGSTGYIVILGNNTIIHGGSIVNSP